MSRRLLWLLWFTLVFGVMNLYGPPPRTYLLRPGDPPNITYGQLSGRAKGFDRFLNDLRDGEDVERYFSYAQAILGKPYLGEYIALTADGAVDGRAKIAGVVSPPGPLVPWRDFLIEYPPGALAPILAPELLAPSDDAYLLIFSLEMGAALTLAVALAVKTAELMGAAAPRAVLLRAILLTALLGDIAIRRYDACVALAIVATIYALAARRPALAGVALALGVLLKGVPILLAPIVVLWFAARRDWRGLRMSAASGAVCLAVGGAAYLAVAGPHALDPVAYHASRGLQIETIYSGALLIAKAFDPGIVSTTFNYGSVNAVAAAEPALRRLASALQVVGIILAYWFAWRRLRVARDDRERFSAVVVASCAALTAFLSLGKVFSPQYFVWLVPLGALAAAVSPGLDDEWLFIAFVFGRLEYPFLSQMLLSPITGLVIVARNLALWRWLAPLARATPAKAVASDKKAANAVSE